MPEPASFFANGNSFASPKSSSVIPFVNIRKPSNLVMMGESEPKSYDSLSSPTKSQSTVPSNASNTPKQLRVLDGSVMRNISCTLDQTMMGEVKEDEGKKPEESKINKVELDQRACGQRILLLLTKLKNKEEVYTVGEIRQDYSMLRDMALSLYLVLKDKEDSTLLLYLIELFSQLARALLFLSTEEDMERVNASRLGLKIKPIRRFLKRLESESMAPEPRRNPKRGCGNPKRAGGPIIAPPPLGDSKMDNKKNDRKEEKSKEAEKKEKKPKVKEEPKTQALEAAAPPKPPVEKIEIKKEIEKESKKESEKKANLKESITVNNIFITDKVTDSAPIDENPSFVRDNIGCVEKGCGQTECVAACTVSMEGDSTAGHVGMEETLKVVDRKKHIFKLSQGEYVAPEKIENIYIRSGLVSQSFVYGESLKTCLIAIVVPDQEVLIPACENKLGLFAPFEELCRKPEVKSLILGDMIKVGKEAGLFSFEQVKDIFITAEPFSIENDLLTPTLKSKRQNLKKVFGSQLAEMYSRLE